MCNLISIFTKSTFHKDFGIGTTLLSIPFYPFSIALCTKKNWGFGLGNEILKLDWNGYGLVVILGGVWEWLEIGIVERETRVVGYKGPNLLNHPINLIHLLNLPIKLEIQWIQHMLPT